MNAAVGYCDTPERYGVVTRALHWLMAMLFVWQFASALFRLLARGSAADQFFWSTHASVGFTLWVLALLRGLWGMVGLRNRPAHDGSLLGLAAALGHVGLYVLMIVVPSLAILRSMGNGRGLVVFGTRLVETGGEPSLWMTAPGNLAHALLGWALMLMILGHIAMVLVHTLVWRDGTLERMTSRPSPSA